MKRAFILALALIMPGLAFAAGPYDGIWRTAHNGEGYMTFHERNNVIIAVGHDVNEKSWEAFDGTRDGNNMILSMVFGLGRSSVQVKFHSDTEGTVTVLSCSADLGSFCNFDPGYSYEIVKEF